MNRYSTVSLAAVPVLALVLLGRVVSTQDVRNANAAALKHRSRQRPSRSPRAGGPTTPTARPATATWRRGPSRPAIVISIIQEQGGKQASDLTDGKWDHGSTDGEIYTVIKKGLPPTMMAGWDGRIPDDEIWSIVNYLRALASNTKSRSRRRPPRYRRHRPPRRNTGAGRLRPDADHRRARRREHPRPARARELPAGEPGGRRFFVNDLNGPLYILDKQSKRSPTYLDFNGLAGRPGLFPKLTFERNFATGLINVVFDPDYARNGVFYTIHMEDPTTEAPASRSQASCRPRSVRLPDDAGGRDAEAARHTHQSRSRRDRMDRPQHRELDVRRHSARAAADPVVIPDSPAR